MSGTIVDYAAGQEHQTWQKYWRTHWHVPLAWQKPRLACLLTAEEARAGRSEETAVANYPEGDRPFLGVMTHDGSGAAADRSGVLEYADDGHLLTVAPTRSGKGIAQIIPNLLLYAGSALVLDIKGENYDKTHKRRATIVPGATVLKFAPLEDGGDRYNPMDFIRVAPNGAPTADTYDDVRLLAQMLMPTKAREEYWDVEARTLVATLIFYIATRYARGSDKRCMKSVVGLLWPGIPGEPADDTRADTDAFSAVLQEMTRFGQMTDNTILLQLIGALVEHDDTVLSNIKSTARSAMIIWVSPRLQAATATSDFQFSDLKRSMCRPADQEPGPTTLYIKIPPHNLRDYQPVLRALVGLAAVELTRRGDWTEWQADGWSARPPCPVLFILDEFPSLGHMPPIEEGVAYLAGYDVQIWTFVQSIGQLRALYGSNWTTFMSNAGAASYFGVADMELAELLSKQLGETEEYMQTYRTRSSSSSNSFSFGSSGNDSSNSGTSVTENAKFNRDMVARPAEIRAMPRELQLVFMRSRKAMIATLLPYHACPLFDGLYETYSP